MGADMALAFAQGGWNCDVVETDAVRAAQARRHWRAECRRLGIRRDAIRLHAGYAAVAWGAIDLLIEAVTEKLALKHRLLRMLEPKLRRTATIATNTSGLRIGDVMRVLQHPARAGGMHFMVPAHVMLPVEVTQGPKTSPATLARLVRWTKELGKLPVVLRRDVPGMLINRIQHAMYREIYHLVDSGVVTPRDVDLAVRFGFGFRYNIVGPMASRDIQGVAVHLATAKNLYPTLHNGRKTPRVLERLVRQGRLGVRSGRGFYDWDAKTRDRRLRKYTDLLEASLARMKRIGEPMEF